MVEVSDRLCVIASTPAEARAKLEDIVNGWVKDASRCTIEATPVIGSMKIVHLREM